MNCCAGGFGSPKRSRKRGNKNLGPALVSKDLAQADGRALTQSPGWALLVSAFPVGTCSEGFEEVTERDQESKSMTCSSCGSCLRRVRGMGCSGRAQQVSKSRRPQGLCFAGSSISQLPSRSSGHRLAGHSPATSNLSAPALRTAPPVSTCSTPLLLISSPVPCQRQCVIVKALPGVLTSAAPVLQASSTMWTPGASSRTLVHPLLEKLIRGESLDQLISYGHCCKGTVFASSTQPWDLSLSSHLLLA